MNLIEHVHSRCIEEGDCWIWQAGCAGKTGEQPQMSFMGMKCYVRRLLYSLANAPSKGKGISTSCQTFRCVNPDHLIELSNSQRIKRAGAAGKFSGTVRRAKIAANKQALHSPLTRQQAMEIRYGQGGTRETATRYGVSSSLVSCIRRGVRWREYSSPFAGLKGNM